MSQLQAIKPVKFQRVIDLVSETGVDVADWANYRKGPNPERASTNPKYCYEWAFFERNKVAVFCLWHRNLKEKNGTIVCEGNMREFAHKMTDEGRHNISQRAFRFNSELQKAVSFGLPVRVIVVDKDTSEKWYLNAEKAEETRSMKRLLDPEPWSVTHYDLLTGDYIITRNGKVQRFIDQFDIPETEGKPEKRQSSGEAYVRDPEVRRKVLERAEGKCEYCGQLGFVMPDDRIYLESHHIIPLHEDGDDLPSNIAALCPNHHREAHFGKNKNEIRELLLSKLN